MQILRPSKGTPVPTAPSNFRVHWKDAERNLPCFFGVNSWDKAIEIYNKYSKDPSCKDVYIHNTKSGEEFR